MTKLHTVRNRRESAVPGDRYKWGALANTTASMFMATLDGAIVIIALPPIFRGIHLDPLAPGSISYLLCDNGERHRARIDWWGNITFAVGLSAVLIAVTYGIQPYGGHTMGWTSPWVLAGLTGGSALLAAFAILETRIEAPMF